MGGEIFRSDSGLESTAQKSFEMPLSLSNVILQVVKTAKTGCVWADPTRYAGEVRVVRVAQKSKGGREVRIWSERFAGDRRARGERPKVSDGDETETPIEPAVPTATPAPSVASASSPSAPSPPKRHLLLLIPGSMESATFYPQEFIDRLQRRLNSESESGKHRRPKDADRVVFDVVRMDNRGFGLSTWVEWRGPAPGGEGADSGGDGTGCEEAGGSWGLREMAEDCVGVIGEWDRAAAGKTKANSHSEGRGDGSGRYEGVHLVGHSLGGAIVQKLLILRGEAPGHAILSRVHSATLLSSSDIWTCDMGALSPDFLAGSDDAIAASESSPEVLALLKQLREHQEQKTASFFGRAKTALTPKLFDTKASAIQRELMPLFHGSSHLFSQAEFNQRLDEALRRGGVNIDCPHVEMFDAYKKAAVRKRRREAKLRTAEGESQSESQSGSPLAPDEARAVKDPTEGRRAAVARAALAGVSLLFVHGTEDKIVRSVVAERLRRSMLTSHDVPEGGAAASVRMTRLVGSGHRYGAGDWAGAVCGYVAAMVRGWAVG